MKDWNTNNQTEPSDEHETNECEALDSHTKRREREKPHRREMKRMKEESMHTFVLGTYADRVTEKLQTLFAVSCSYFSGFDVAHFVGFCWSCRCRCCCWNKSNWQKVLCMCLCAFWFEALTHKHTHPVPVIMGHLATHMKQRSKKREK